MSNNLFNKKGYIVKKDLISSKLHSELFFMFYDLAYSCINRNNIKCDFTIKNINQIKFSKDIKELDKLLLKILDYNNKLMGELYDTVSYSSTFLKLVSNSHMEDTARSLLNLKKHNTIYSYTHRIRIDPPRDERRTYGWHQEIFYTIPNTKFVQTWCPLIRNTTMKNGTIEVCEGSHKEGVAKQTWNEANERATQIIVDANIVKKYKESSMPMKLGEVLFFDPHLFHRSGHNSTKDEIRFSLVGMWNDTTDKKFRAPKPEFKSRTISAKENFDKLIRKVN